MSNRLSHWYSETIENEFRKLGIIDSKEIKTHVKRIRVAGDSDLFREEWFFDNKMILRTRSEWKDNIFRLIIETPIGGEVYARKGM